MIDELRISITKHAEQFGYEHIDQSALSFTKFCQRIVEEHTKVLFLVTYKNKELCIIKTVRNAQHNERLQNEATVQKTLFNQGVQHIPQVLFEGKINEAYFYAESVVSGITPSRSKVKNLEKEILGFVASLPINGAYSSSEVHRILKTLTIEDKALKHLIEMFGTYDVSLKRGITHSDLGRPNILVYKNSFTVIDWERANDLPFWMIDGVYFIMKIHQIHSRDSWRRKGFPVLQKHVVIDEQKAEVLYIIATIGERLKKKYPKIYQNLTNKIHF